MTQETGKEAGKLSDKLAAVVLGMWWYIWQSIGSLVWEEWLGMMLEAAFFAVAYFWVSKLFKRKPSPEAQDSSESV